MAGKLTRQKIVRVDPVLDEWLQRDAAEHGRTVSQSIRFHLDAARARSMSTWTLPSAFPSGAVWSSGGIGGGSGYVVSSGGGYGGGSIALSKISSAGCPTECEHGVDTAVSFCGECHHGP